MAVVVVLPEEPVIPAEAEPSPDPAEAPSGEAAPEQPAPTWTALPEVAAEQAPVQPLDANPLLSDKLLEAFQTRRIMLERSGFVGVRVFGQLGDPELMAIREFFDKNKVPHTWIDADAPA